MVFDFDIQTLHPGSPTTSTQTQTGGDDDIPEFQMPSNDTTKKVRLPPTAAFNLELYSYNDDGSWVKGDSAGGIDPLILGVFTHNAYPSMVYKFGDAVVAFLEECRQTKPNFPVTFNELEKSLRAKFVMTSDPAPQSQIAYRRGVYMCMREVKQVVAFLDSFLAWRHRTGHDGDFPEVLLTIKNATGRDINLTGIPYETTVTVEQTQGDLSIPCQIFTVPGPSWTKLHPHVLFEKIDEKNMKIRFEGETWTFKGPFHTHKIPGRYEKKDGTLLPEDASDTEKRSATYVRIIKKIDVAQIAQKNFVLQAVNTTVYNGTCFMMTWVGAYASGEAVRDFKDEIHKLPNAYPAVA
jgi:hypothetical protein